MALTFCQFLFQSRDVLVCAVQAAVDSWMALSEKRLNRRLRLWGVAAPAPERPMPCQSAGEARTAANPCDTSDLGNRDR